jgi:hypothetical protein
LDLFWDRWCKCHQPWLLLIQLQLGGHLIVYLIRRVRPTAEQTETQKKIKEIAQSCQRDKSESWISSQIDKIKGYILNTNTRRPDPSLPGI